MTDFIPCLVSIVVPVYNVEKYLLSCLTSIVSQSYSDIEIILVDDGSTDHSGDICDHFAEIDKRVIVIHEKNAGLGPARNTGVASASGEWVTFVDSDDEIHPKYVEFLLRAALFEDSDISLCEYKEIWRDERPQYDVTPFPNVSIVDPKQAIEKMLSGKCVPYMIACAKLYRRELLNDNKFKKMICEDTDFLSRLYLQINHVSYINTQLYYYFRREGTISRSSGFRKSQVMANWGIAKFYISNHPEFTLDAVKMCLRSLINYYQQEGIDSESEDESMNLIREECWKLVSLEMKLNVEKRKLQLGLFYPRLYRYLQKIRRYF